MNHILHHRSALGLILAATALALVACASPPPSPAPAESSKPMAISASARLVATTGNTTNGIVRFVQTGTKVRVTGGISGLKPGAVHGFHVHEKGDCSSGDGMSTGGHFNPTGAPHGRAEAGPHHAGDMDNLVADADGTANVDVHLAGVTLGGGAATDIVGRALIVHAQPDDYSTQPTGNSGARIACAVIQRAG